MTAGLLEAELPSPAPRRVLGFGAWLKNRVCLLEGQRVLWSLGHGDLGDPANCRALEASVESLLASADKCPDVVAHDLHPDFFSTRLARKIALRFDIRAEPVQHHHAHIGVVLAEQGLDEPVIGLALDGVGLGSDGGAWGGEVLWVNGGAASDDWQRVDHLPPLSMPGGDVAAREPWRMAAAVLFALDRGQEIAGRYALHVGADRADGLLAMLQRGVNCPPTTSAGRWFDAASGALGLSLVQAAEAEAAQRLESHATQWLTAHPDFRVADNADLMATVAELFDLAARGEEARARGAAAFHLALINDLARRAHRAAATHGVKSIVLAGGCFYNQILQDRLPAVLRAAGYKVLLPRTAGCGDAGIALGQAWIGACRNRF